mmetsp:Transcript_86873/g.202235  ORF Transcript_86873/g.202235 Transcript_86873/m.202235 type:complete len:250 (+) Transcript_86873:239-988(+)
MDPPANQQLHIFESHHNVVAVLHQQGQLGGFGSTLEAQETCHEFLPAYARVSVVVQQSEQDAGSGCVNVKMREIRIDFLVVQGLSELLIGDEVIAIYVYRVEDVLECLERRLHLHELFLDHEVLVPVRNALGLLHEDANQDVENPECCKEHKQRVGTAMDPPYLHEGLGQVAPVSASRDGFDEGEHGGEHSIPVLLELRTDDAFLGVVVVILGVPLQVRKRCLLQVQCKEVHQKQEQQNRPDHGQEARQ